jgi:hypothetical protein
MRKKHLLALLCAWPLFLFSQTELTDQKRFAFDPQLTYDAAVPSPESFLGYLLGEELTLYGDIVQYFEKLAAASPKITLHTYGKTYEGRRLLNVVITSEANQRNLEEIRSRHLRLTDPDAISATEAAQLIDKQPVFLSMSYGIHGNETSSSETVMQVAYRLAAAQDEATRNLLDNSVIVLYVCINPDGRDRYVYWYKSMQRNLPATEPNDVEHYEPWPAGRTNHYWFDLNRDWFFMVNQESRAHSTEYQRWMPQMHVDYHEQGYNSNYFTTPGTTPRNLLLPKRYEIFSDTFGRANIREFDKHKISYFTREVFDFFYPGYGSSYPGVLGAVSMLTEQGGIGGGRSIKTEDGYVLTLRQRVWDHYITSMATLLKAGDMRKELLQYSFDVWNHRNSASSVKAYFLPDNPGGYVYDVISMLMAHGVRVERATADVALPEAINYRSGKTERRTISKGAFVIPANQSRHLFLHSVMERNMAIEDSVMYDVSTWSVPLAFNLEAYASTAPFKVATERLDKAPEQPAGVQKAEAAYAYVIEWKQRHAPRALAALWEKGYRVRAALEPFSDGKNKYGEGTLIVLAGSNLEKADSMAADMAHIAAAAKVVIHGHSTGRMAEGFDLASSKNRPVERPKVALMVDPPFDMYSCGQIYFLFDQETRLPVERIRTSVLRQTALPKFGARYGYADLKDYQVLILPNGGAGLREVFQKDQLDQLKAWVEAGGVLIAQEGAAPFFTDDRSKFTKVKLLEIKKDSSERALQISYAERNDFNALKNIPGAALNTTVDNTHPLAFGMDKTMYSLKSGALALKPDPDLHTVGRYVPDAAGLLASGYASQENLKHLAGNTFAGVMPMGRGKVVFLVDNPQFRMYWRGPSRMMQNAVMLLPGF